MRHLCATSLAVLLCVHPLLAEGPLARSAVKEAARLAGETGEDGGSDVWKAVRLLDRRAAIVVTRAGQPVAATFVAFTDSAITVMRNGAAESIPLDDIQMVEKRVRRGSALAATLGALGGVFLGTALAIAVSYSSNCYDACGGSNVLAWTAFIGVPVVGGYGAWRASSHLTEEVIYRRSPAAP